MAWALTNTGNHVVNKTGGMSSWTPFQIPNTDYSGKLLVIWIASDNDANPTFSISKKTGETNDWVLLSYSYVGSGATGTAVQIHAIDMSVSWALFSPVLSNGSTLPTAKVMRWSIFEGGSVADATPTPPLVGGNPSSGHSITFTGANAPLAGDLALAATSAEGSANSIGMGDTAGWVTENHWTTGGTSLGNIALAADYKLYSADDDNDSYSPTTSIDSGTAAILLRQPSAAPPNEGTASGTVDFTGSATGDMPAHDGTASGTVDFAGSATGAQPPNDGTGTGSVDLAGSATGERSSAGSASGSTDLAGSAAGSAPRSGAVTASVDFAGSATGKMRPFDGVASGSLVFHAGDVTGWQPVPFGVASGSVTVAITEASGESPQVGFASGSLAFSGAASGALEPKGQASGSVALAGSAAGERAYQGSASGTVSLAATTLGSKPHYGTASGATDFSGSAAGEAPALTNWSIVNGGTITAESSFDTNLVISSNLQFNGQVGDVLVVWIATDSSAAGEPVWSLNKPAAETSDWSLLAYSEEDSAAGTNLGMVLQLWGIDVTTTDWSGFFLAATSSASVTKKISWYGVFRGGVIANADDAPKQGGNTTGSLSLAFTGVDALQVGDLVLSAAVSDDAYTGGVTAPPMTYQGQWAASGGGLYLRFEYLLVDTAGNFTYAPTSSGDAASVAIVLRKTGAVVKSGSGTGTTTFTGAATGASEPFGSASGTVTYTGSAAGEVPPSGDASGTVDYSGSSAGATGYQGSVTANVISTGTASGTAPLVAGSSGGASGSVGYSGTSSGTRVGKGSAVGYVSTSGQVSGVTTRDGYAVGTVSHVASLVRGGARGIVDATVVLVGPTRHALDVDQRPRRTLIFSGVGGHVFDPAQQPRHNFRPGRPDGNTLDVEGARS